MFYDYFNVSDLDILIAWDESGLKQLRFIKDSGTENLPEKGWIRRSSGTGSSTVSSENVKKQLDEYFEGKRRIFDIKVSFDGTKFQKSVWNALREIPYGETATYKEISEKVGCLKGYRAVGLANNRNPIPIIIPCHRVIGSDGSLTGYAGGLDIKKKLLILEKMNFN